MEGGFIRSLGGWKEAKKARLSRQDRIKGDERILGGSDFVMEVLGRAGEWLENRYRLKSLGWDVEKVERKLLSLYNLERDDLYSGSRKKAVSEARSLFCYWCVRELGESMAAMARRLGLTQPGVGYAVDRGGCLAKKEGYELEP